MGIVNESKVGLVFAALMGGFHFLWTILVALHWAQPIINFIFWLHFIQPVYVIDDFSAVRALILIAVTAIIGYAGGSCGAFVWNRIHK